MRWPGRVPAVVRRIIGLGLGGPFSIGLDEVAIGMTMHHAGIELARDRLRKSAFHRSVINAEMFDPQGTPTTGWLPGQGGGA